MLKLSLSRMVVIIVFKECLGVLNSGKDYSFMLQALSFELVWRLLFRFFFPFWFICEARETGNPQKPDLSCFTFHSVNITDFEKCTYVKVKRKAKQNGIFFAS